MADVQRQPESQAEGHIIGALLVCPKCGESNPEDLRYCEHCGASLAGVVPKAKSLEASSGEKGGFFSRLFGRK